MSDFFTFANTPHGKELRDQLVDDMTKAGRTVRLFAERIETSTALGPLTITLLRVEVTGKRKGEGEIARDMKARKK